MDERSTVKYGLGARGAGTKEAVGGQHHDPRWASSSGPFLAPPRRAAPRRLKCPVVFFPLFQLGSVARPTCASLWWEGRGMGLSNTTLAHVNTGAATCLGYPDAPPATDTDNPTSHRHCTSSTSRAMMPLATLPQHHPSPADPRHDKGTAATLYRTSTCRQHGTNNQVMGGREGGQVTAMAVVTPPSLVPNIKAAATTTTTTL